MFVVMSVYRCVCIMLCIVCVRMLCIVCWYVCGVWPFRVLSLLFLVCVVMVVISPFPPFIICFVLCVCDVLLLSLCVTLAYQGVMCVTLV